MLALPDGYWMGPTTRRQVAAHHKMLGSEWEMLVYYEDYPVFEIVKQVDEYTRRPRFAGRLADTVKWQEFSSLNVMVRVMCTKHRIGVNQCWPPRHT
jgi:hypothetical protein